MQNHLRPQRKFIIPFITFAVVHTTLLGIQGFELNQYIILFSWPPRKSFLAPQKNPDKNTKIPLNSITPSLTPID